MPRSKTTLLGRPDKLSGHRVNIALLKEATLVACSLVNPAIFGFIAAIGEFERSSREVDPKFTPPVRGSRCFFCLHRDSRSIGFVIFSFDLFCYLFLSSNGFFLISINMGLQIADPRRTLCPYLLLAQSVTTETTILLSDRFDQNHSSSHE
jgi:hypothetical protein